MHSANIAYCLNTMNKEKYEGYNTMGHTSFMWTEKSAVSTYNQKNLKQTKCQCAVSPVQVQDP